MKGGTQRRGAASPAGHGGCHSGGADDGAERLLRVELPLPPPPPPLPPPPPPSPPPPSSAAAAAAALHHPAGGGAARPRRRCSWRRAMSESARRSTLEENLPTSTSHCPRLGLGLANPNQQQKVGEQGW
eukprot:scaffold105246_cov43-Phaeocystis_antarctica.AAC.1